MSLSIPNPLPPDENRGHLVLTVTWAITGVAALLVALRLHTRIFLRKCAGWDDFLMAVALMVNIVSATLVTIDIHYGFGRHIYYLEPAHALQSRKYLSIGTLTGFVDQFFSRASIVVFVMRMTPPDLQWPQRCAWTAHALNLVVLITALIGFGLQCIPFRGAWDLSIKSRCYSTDISRNLIYATGVLNCITDLTTALTPMVLLRNLNMSRRIMICIYACLALGLLCFVCSIGKMAQIDYTEDFTWTLVPSIIWSTFESKVAVIVGSLPALRQLYTYIRYPPSSDGPAVYYPTNLSSVRPSLLKFAHLKPQKFSAEGRKSESDVALKDVSSNPSYLPSYHPSYLPSYRTSGEF